jgi:hypothetical protein
VNGELLEHGFLGVFRVERKPQEKERLMRFTLPVSMLFAFVTGCAGSIHVVEDAKSGGTVALHGSEDGAREKAEQHMKTRCPGGFEIVEQGEASTDDGSREWRITYACKGPGTVGGKVARIAF